VDKPKITHPSADQLVRFSQGRLSEAEIAELAAHLSTCPACVAIAEASGDDTLISLLRAADTEREVGSPQNPSQAETVALPGATAEIRGLPAELATHGRYRVQELLGVGGMGAVYKAEYLLMERPVALKLISHRLTSNPAMVERFRREVKTAGQLRHANIVMAFDAEQAGDSHFLVMEYVEGKSLARTVKEQGPLPVALACDYIRQAALGLQYAHERSMVHRDIKPQNLMHTPDGQVKILDFGLARFAMEAAPTGSLLSGPILDAGSSGSATGSLTQAGAVMGTPDYIAPEQAKDAHTADIRADIYSLGCTLYDLLTGHAPFPGGTALDKVQAHAERSPRPLTELRRDIPPELARVVDKMMAKDPAKRYQTPAEVAEALKRFTESASPKPERSNRQIARRIVAAAAMAVFVVLAGAIIYVQTDKGEFIIETEDENAAVMLNKGGGVKIVDQSAGREYVLKPGSHHVRTGEYAIDVGSLPDDIEISEGKTFTVKRGGKVVATAKLTKKDDKANQDAKIEAAGKAAEAFLRKIDSGDYESLWGQFASWAKEHRSKREQVVQSFEWFRQEFGKLISRTPEKPQHLTTVPNVGHWRLCRVQLQIPLRAPRSCSGTAGLHARGRRSMACPQLFATRVRRSSASESPCSRAGSDWHSGGQVHHSRSRKEGVDVVFEGHSGQ
jgi:serine/threonine protein kinase